jgi:phosphoribosylformylglycinamidine (FGAM) synthase-like enzyme
MAVATAWTRRDVLRKTRVVSKKMTYDNGDTSIVVNTGLKRIFSFDVSPTSVTAKKVNCATVAGGVITVTVADPLAACYLVCNAYGI